MVSHFSIILKKLKLCFFLDELNHLEENAKAVQEEFQQSCENRKEKGARSVFPVTGCVHGRNCVIR